MHPGVLDLHELLYSNNCWRSVIVIYILLMFPCDGVPHLFHIVGFSRQMVDLLNSHGAKFSHFDILSDNEVRQGMYVFSLIPCTVFTRV